MKTKTIISSLLVLSLCTTLYAAPRQDNSFQELKAEVTGVILEQFSKPTLDDLIKAIKQNDLKAVRTLINKGVNINAQLADGSTPLIEAVKTKDIDIEIVKLLIRKKNINTYDKKGMDALMWAVKKHADIEIIKLLVAKGADLTAEDGEYCSALGMAFKEKEEDVALFLIEKGAPVEMSYEISWAAERNWMEVLKALVERGANVNPRRGIDVHPPLDYAIMNENIEMVEYLLEHGADVNYTKSKNSPLSYAVFKNRADIARLLLERGAKLRWIYRHYYDYLMPSNLDNTPMVLFAAWKGNKEMVELLIEYGADVNEKSEEGLYTALGRAAEIGNIDVAELLIKKGADIEALDNGNTPLLNAVFYNKIKMVEFLIAKGADVNAKNRNGNTALRYARKNKNKEMIKLLKQHGARRW